MNTISHIETNVILKRTCSIQFVRKIRVTRGGRTLMGTGHVPPTDYINFVFNVRALWSNISVVVSVPRGGCTLIGTESRAPYYF